MEDIRLSSLIKTEVNVLVCDLLSFLLFRLSYALDYFVKLLSSKYYSVAFVVNYNKHNNKEYPVDR